MGGIAPPNIFKLARKLVKSQQCCKRVGHSIFCNYFLEIIVGQLVKTPPPQTEGISAHHRFMVCICSMQISRAIQHSNVPLNIERLDVKSGLFDG